MKKLLILLIFLSIVRIVWQSAAKKSLKTSPKSAQTVTKPSYPFVFEPSKYFIKTLHRRYWGGARVFFKQLEPILARYNVLEGYNKHQLVRIRFEIDCQGEMHLLNIHNAPSNEFAQDIQGFLTSAKFRWLKCNSSFKDKFDFRVLLSPNIE